MLPLKVLINPITNTIMNVADTDIIVSAKNIDTPKHSFRIIYISILLLYRKLQLFIEEHKNPEKISNIKNAFRIKFNKVHRKRKNQNMIIIT
jgi:hypothetical protein